MDVQRQIPNLISPLDFSKLPENISGVLGAVSGFVEGVETACSSEEFIVRHVIGPAVEATLASYLKYCVPETEQFLSDNWSLCSPDHSFNCNNIRNYTSQCKTRRDSVPMPTPSTESRTNANDDGTAMLFVVVALIIGIVIGVVLTVVVCLVCPNTYRWTSKKLGRKAMFAPDKPRQQSEVSDYYAAIDDRNNYQNIPLRSVPNGPEVSTYSNEQYLMHRSDHNDVTLSDSRIQNEARAPAPELASPMPRLDHQESCDSSNYTSISYDQLDRNRPHNQSHSYDCIGRTSPVSPVESEHSYFVLERTSETS